MIRLSARGWNNVLIISVLVMILIFNSSQWLQTDSAQPTARGMIEEGQVLLSLDFTDTKLERIGQDWRLNPQLSEPADARAIAAQWQTLWMEPFGASSLQQGYVISAWMAGSAEPVIYTLMAVGDDVLVEVQGATYRITNTPIDTLIPGV